MRTCDLGRGHISYCNRRDSATQTGRSRELECLNDHRKDLKSKIQPSFLKSFIEWQDFGILHKIPDIWTAATPVIIHEAALKGSARRRWWGWSGGEGGWLWWWYCWNVYSSSATKFQNISLHLQIVCRENYLGLRNLTKWKMSRTNKTDIEILINRLVVMMTL